MTDTLSRAGLDDLFRQWKQFLDNGDLTTAAYVADGQPDLVAPLQQQINEYFSLGAARLHETLTADPSTVESHGLPDIPGYTVLAALGAGGMGVVYRVRDRLGREFAMKMARPGKVVVAGRPRPFEEALTMARLQHPNIVAVHDYIEHAGTPYILMPIYAASMRDRLDSYKADPLAAVRVMERVADAVGYLHEKGYVHRDLKPHNVLLAADGAPAVGDFGLIKHMADPTPTVPITGKGDHSTIASPAALHDTATFGGAVLGTWRYMPPEQGAGLTQLVNPTWDVYALGVMLHELLTGACPRSSESPERLLDPSEPDNPPPSEVKPGLDPELERILVKCLHRRAADRYADARPLAADLRRWLARQGERRRWAGIAAVLAGIGVAIALVVVAPWRERATQTVVKTPESLRSELIDRLRAGNAVSIVGAEGRPVTYRTLGVRSGAIVVEDRAEFTINVRESALIELVPAGACPQGFELTAQVKFINNFGPGSVAGPYFGHDSNGADHTFAHFGFTEYGDVVPPGINVPANMQAGSYQLRLEHWISPDDPRPTEGGLTTLINRPFVAPRPAPRADGEWYALKIRITPAEIGVDWQEKPAGTMSMADLNALWQAHFGAKLPRPPFGPDGGAGLFVTNATVAFRNVTVTPIAP